MALLPFILLAVAAIVLIEVPRMRRKRLKKELWSFSVLLVLGTALCVSKALGSHLRSPLAYISYVFKPMGELLLKMIS
ncbi:hypothetical protein P5G65_01200 [Paenibacillus chondroitinus]|uniref:Uncharacterized protein n=1 Tax=Paenibacillus chondroitinus TaxID=59842 RepID=A0ABU6D6B9_9BACL|nr:MULTISPECIES: hypothetical protein [Paenibacillus]MCY9661246.1 hypothetical protein [Paenibacillus anseongense]MEB4792501.1 hypothetical protein [Paenibacillus chondroitinus]